MEILELVLEILKFIIPAVVVFLTAFYILKQFFENEHRRRVAEAQSGNNKITLPIRLQAYERCALFLERISPESLVMRTHTAGSTARKFQGDLLSTIRSEFEHNLVQQIYISKGAWEILRTAKDETVKLINLAAEQVGPSASGLQLGEAIIKLTGQLEKLPTQVALEYLKKEVQQNF